MKKISTIYLLTCIMITSYCLHGSEGTTLSIDSLSPVEKKRYQQFVAIQKIHDHAAQIATELKNNGEIEIELGREIWPPMPSWNYTKNGLFLMISDDPILVSLWGTIKIYGGSYGLSGSHKRATDLLRKKLKTRYLGKTLRTYLGREVSVRNQTIHYHVLEVDSIRLSDTVKLGHSPSNGDETRKIHDTLKTEWNRFKAIYDATH